MIGQRCADKPHSTIAAYAGLGPCRSHFRVLIRVHAGMPAERSDAELLSGDDAADLGYFYDRHLGAVSAFVGSRIHRPEVLFDLIAETFARALERRRQYEENRGPAVAWLLGIARNLIVDSARRGQVEATSRSRLGMARIELGDEQLALVAERAGLGLGAALASLGAGQREAVIRRVVLEESYAAVAANLRCSEQVARKRVSRGLARLRTSLEER